MIVASSLTDHVLTVEKSNSLIFNFSPLPNKNKQRELSPLLQQNLNLSVSAAAREVESVLLPPAGGTPSLASHQLPRSLP